MSNLVDDLIAGFQTLIGQVPEALQPLVIAAAGAVPFIEGEGAALIGVIGGLNPVVAALAGATGNILCVVLVVLLGSRIRTAIGASRRLRAAAVPVTTPITAPITASTGGTSSVATLTRPLTAETEVAPAKPESKGRLRLRRWLVRFGVPGASLLAPLALPTPFTAATLVASGVNKGWVILWQAIAIVVWTTGVTVGATIFLNTGRPDGPGMTDVDGLLGRLREDLRRLGTEHEVPGVSLAVLAGGNVTEATFGVVNTRTGVPVTPDTLFMIQSVTKILTATLVMQLVDAGLVALDDPIRTHLRGFRTAAADVSGQITVRHLLTHTGGFEGDLWAATTSGPDALQRFVGDLVSQARQHSAPGELFSYCNAGYGVLGRLVEVLRGTTYEEAVRRYLAEPLGIGELAFSADQALAYRTAIGHVRPDPSSALRPLRHWAVMPPSNPAAGNQLAMSARGLLAVARMHVADGRSPDGTPVLSVASTRLMRESQVDHPAAVGAPSRHGLGWWLERNELAEHGGGSTGIAAMLRTAPRHGLAAVVLTNAESGAEMIDDLLDPYFADVAGISPVAPLPTPAGDTRLADPRPYVGHFESRQGRFEVTRDDDGGLWHTHIPQHESVEFAARAGIPISGGTHELRRISGDTFMIIDSAGQPARPVEFLGRDARAQFLFDGGRAHPRSD